MPGFMRVKAETLDMFLFDHFAQCSAFTVSRLSDDSPTAFLDQRLEPIPALPIHKKIMAENT